LASHFIEHWFLPNGKGHALNKAQALEHAAQPVQQAADAINWPVVFYICFGLAVLYVLHNVMGLSFTRFVGAILREFQLFLGPGPINRAKLNALVVLVLLCFTAFYAFVEPIRHLIELTGNFRGNEAERFYVEVVAVFTIGVVGLLSVVSTPP